MGCDVKVRGGRPCQNRRLNYSVGPMGLTLCNRHLTAYKEERAGALLRVEREHKDGLHGEGEDREQFANQYESGKFWLICRLCKDELRSEKVGVKPEQVEEAEAIDLAMKVALEDADTRKRSFITSFGVDPVSTLNGKSESLRFALALSSHYQRVQAVMELGIGWGEDRVEKPNLVEAYEFVKKEVERNLIQNKLGDDSDRSAASAFVRLTRW